MTNKKWLIVYSAKAKKAFERVDKVIQKRIDAFLYKTLPKQIHPKKTGGPLTNSLKGLWRYRVGDYRIVCDIRENELVILVVQVAHRKEVYKTMELH